MSKSKKKVISKGFKTYNIIMWILLVIVTIYFGYSVSKTNMIPNKYFVIGIITLTFILILFGAIVIFKKNGFKRFILIDIIMIIAIIIETFTASKISAVYSFLEDNLGVKYETNIYNVVVNVNSSFNSFSDLSQKEINYYNDLENKQLLINSINDKINKPNLKLVDDINSSFLKLLKDKKYVLIINAGNYDSIIENNDGYEEKVKVIGTIEIKTELKETKKQKVDVTKDPFVLFISGIDTRSGKLPQKSLSDVNIIMAINPNTKKILMVHIPRDYYVKVPGKNGYRDKLTHTGTIGGVNLTIKTIEEQFKIDLPYYVRLNFNSVVKLVDAIGGIDVYSDVNYKFNSSNLPSLTIYPLQMNHLNGQEALAFAKERHAYASGDRHRGENQEQVLQRVIEKMTSSTTLLNKFNEILRALNGTFETNVTSEDISALVKMQLNDMSKWNIETYNVDGTGSMEYTYSYKNQKLYVMYPNEATVSTAVKKLQDVLKK